MRRPREVGFEVAPGLMGLSNIGIVFGHVGDLLLLARLALEAAIPNENVLIELLSPDLAAMSSVDGSRVASDKLTQRLWSGAVFCSAC
jgi:hypothetical protein